MRWVADASAVAAYLLGDASGSELDARRARLARGISKLGAVDVSK